MMAGQLFARALPALSDFTSPRAWAFGLIGIHEYLQRLSGPDLERVRADLECLVAFARQEKWPRQEVQFLKTFLSDYGIETVG